jgi:uncharacterized beta barrel domain-containing protein DUF5777
MSKTRALFIFWVFLVLTFARSAHAADDSAPPLATTAPAAAATAAADDDEGTLNLAEPDYRLINLPTTLRLPLFKSNFDLTHRFNGNLRRGSFTDQLSTLFGIDDGALIGLEYRFAIARHLELAAYRTTIAQTIEIYGKYDVIHQHDGVPFSASPILSIEGTNNLQEEFAPVVGASVSRTISDFLAVYAVPMWVHNSAAGTGAKRDTTYLGVGARLRIRPTVYLAAEVSPRLSGYAPGKPLYGFAIEKRAGAHMFQLNFNNGANTTLAQIARGGQPNNLQMGFNLARKFY